MTKEEFITYISLRYPPHQVRGAKALLDLVDTVEQYRIIEELIKQTEFEVEYDENQLY